MSQNLPFLDDTPQPHLQSLEPQQQIYTEAQELVEKAYHDRWQLLKERSSFLILDSSYLTYQC